MQGSGWGGRTQPLPRGPEPLPPGRSALAGSWLPPRPPARARKGWSHGPPSMAVSPDPRTGLAQTEKQGCLWGVGMGGRVEERRGNEEEKEVGGRKRKKRRKR